MPQKKNQFQKFTNPDVAETFSEYSPSVREKLFRLRELIFETAQEIQEVGRIEEVLKWGQPSYLTPESKSGTTIRIDAIKGESKEYAIFFHCQTDLISRFRKLYPKTFHFEGNRSIIFSESSKLPEKELKQCISFALTYHSDKKKKPN
ncbi:DUF1801 domain-containing protein [Leptospira andrefontaineae]|uniref:DUF1801 domain-containing protein n=1 Tax=Leptospira andrefontaineae TaxID=2484976 RepID=A0A4R9H6I7_9LEPT|nr:DUF1801 domain-containing protein [Leptospira andrefontaineae]TGK41194.1 DUF1801 domain-containing protein [Leptospira andrefontaineae]